MKLKTQTQQKIARILRKNLTVEVIVAITILMIALAYGGSYWISSKYGYAESLEADAKSAVIAKYRALDGVAIKEEEDLGIEAQVWAAIIDARDEGAPVRGISKAGVVYELPVEGTFTRFLAFFPYGISDIEVGPIRSIRPYFINIVKEYGSMVAHAGGSPSALKRIKEVRSLNEISYLGPKYFFRDSTRLAPYNLFILSDDTVDAVLELGDKEENFNSWVFKDDPALKSRTKTPKNIKVGQEEFIYNRNKNSYEWRRNGKAQIDGGDNKKIFAKNVVIMKVPKPKVLDNEGRLSIQLTGSGEAKIYRDGALLEGIWRKGKDGLRVKWLHKPQSDSKKEIPLNRGLTWIFVSS